jgi:lipopolysaccharide transport system permease protein
MQVEEAALISSLEAEKQEPRRLKIIRPVSFSPWVVFTGMAELLRHRDLLYTLTLHRIKVRYKQSALGLGWAVIQPLALMLIYTVIFSMFAKVPHKEGHYALFVLAGILPWNFFQTAVSASSIGFVNHSNLVTKIYFPREIIPLSYVLAALVDFFISCGIMSLMMAWYHVGVGWTALYLIPILLIECLFTLGVGLLLSLVQVRFRDIGLAMPLILQLWMFGSPVVYGFSNVPERFRSLYVLNPLAGLIENFRRVLIGGIGPDLSLLTLSTVLSLILLPAAYMYFKHWESTMADII